MVVGVVIVWVAALVRVVLTVRRIDLARASFTAATLLVAMALTVRISQAQINALLHTPNIADLIEHALFAAAACGTQLFLLALRTAAPPAPQIYQRILVAGLVILTIVLLFAAAPVHRIEAVDIESQFGFSDLVVAYRCVLDAYLTYCLIDNTRLCIRHGRTPGDRTRSVSLFLIGAGCGAAAVGTVAAAASITIDHIRGAQLASVHHLGSVAVAAAALLLGLGITAPAPTGWLLRVARAHHDQSQLDGLWGGVTTLCPETLLPPPPTSSLLEQLELRALRRQIEITDALRTLRLPLGAAEQVTRSANPAAALGAALRHGQISRDETAGRPATDLLPTPANDAAERVQLLTIARGYRQPSAVRPQHEN